MAIPILDPVPDGWKYDAENSDPEHRRYKFTGSSQFGPNTSASVREVNDDKGRFYVLGTVMSETRLDEHVDSTDDANEALREFMENNPY